MCCNAGISSVSLAFTLVIRPSQSGTAKVKVVIKLAKITASPNMSSGYSLCVYKVFTMRFLHARQLSLTAADRSIGRLIVIVLR